MVRIRLVCSESREGARVAGDYGQVGNWQGQEAEDTGPTTESGFLTKYTSKLLEGSEHTRDTICVSEKRLIRYGMNGLWEYKAGTKAGDGARW